VSTGSYIANVTVDDTEVGELAVGDEVTLTRSTGSTTTGRGGFGGGGFGGFGGGGGGGGGTTGTTGTSTATVDTTPFFGTVSSVSLVASSTSGVASYPVVIAVTGSPAKLYSGTTVTAAITYKTLANVLEVPTTAIHRATDGSSYVLKSVGGKLTQTTITTGVASAGETQVLTGLTAGDEVQEITIARAAGAGGAGGRTRGGAGTGGFGGGFAGGGE
jgi:macrolide-specific efflux system membrane fusion protein